MESHTTTFVELSDDLITNILIRLRAQSLLMLKQVCKSWCSLISSREFVSAHLIRCREDSDSAHCKILLNCRDHLKQCSVSSLMHEPVTDSMAMELPASQPGQYFWLVGSCDGLVCLIERRKDLTLWNPSTGACKKLPDFGAQAAFGSYITFGLGFDKLTDDYKVVCLFKADRKSKEMVVKIHSSRSNQWRSIKNFKDCSLMDDPAVFAHGRLYWVAYSDHLSPSEWELVSLDLGTEEFEILRMPNYVESGHYSRLAVSEGNLYVLCSHLTCAELWIMDSEAESNVSWIWTKVATIPYIDDLLKYTYKKVVYVSKNGRVLQLCGSTFVVFDSREPSFSYPEIINSEERVSAAAYNESLVSPIG